MFFSASVRSIDVEHDTSVRKLGKGGTRCPQRVYDAAGLAFAPSANFFGIVFRMKPIHLSLLSKNSYA